MAAELIAAKALEASGIDPEALFREGVDAFLEWTGITSCSGQNKAIYRAMAAAQPTQAILDKLEGRRPIEGTGNCQKAHRAYLAEELMRRVPGAVGVLRQGQAVAGGALTTDYLPDPTRRYREAVAGAAQQAWASPVAAGVRSGDMLAELQIAQAAGRRRLSALRQQQAQQQRARAKKSGGGLGWLLVPAGLAVGGVALKSKKGKR